MENVELTEEVLDTIQRVSERYASRYAFGYYEKDDIMQEAFLIALDGLKRYDGIRPLENFLAVHIRNRLITFMRDNYYRKDLTTEEGERINETKKMLIDTLDISVVDIENEPNMVRGFDYDKFFLDELINEIQEHLQPEFREDYLKYMDGVKLTKAREDKLLNHIYDIVGEKHGEDW